MDERALKTLEYYKVRDLVIARCQTALGKELAGGLMPSSDLLLVERRQQETAEALALLMAGRRPPFGGIRDIRPAVGRAARGALLEAAELLDIADTIGGAKRLRRHLTEEGAAERPVLTALAGLLYAPTHLEAEIRKAITEHGEVADSASPTLASLRRALRVTQARVKEKLEALIRGPQAKYLQEAIVTIRDSRYVVPVKIEYRAQVPGLVHDQSASGSTLFVEPLPVVELNNEVKQLTLEEQAEIARILTRLSALVGQEERSLTETCQVLGQLDLAVAKAQLALDLDCTAPKLNQEGRLVIRQGRHPLLKGNVVPVDVHLGRDFDILVITGPNTGGKTVTLKTMGLFCLMAAAGLQVPAKEGTELALFEQIFSDIGDEQSIEQSLSTFSSHMTNIVRILNELEGPALVMLDELGAGTDPTEGAALATAILEHLHARGAKVVITTHYSELKAYAYQRPRVENASVEFDVETLRPTYRLLIGVPGRSNAFEISRRLGLNPAIVERAKGLLSEDEEKLETMISGMAATSAQLEEERRLAAHYKAEAERAKAAAEAALEKARRREQEILSRAQEEASLLLGQVRREADEIMKQLKVALAQGRAREQQEAIREARSRLKHARAYVGHVTRQGRTPGPAAPAPRELRVGQAVYVRSLDLVGHVLAEPDSGGQVQIQAGIMKVMVPVADLELRAEAPVTTKQGRGTPYLAGGLSRTQEISPEVDLRGLSAEEALGKVDKYLDSAILAGLGQVRIIHGKGTGVLRQAINQYLRGHRAVDSFRLGLSSEGGDGVTVAKLKS